jgi:UDP-glucose 4-epimerase
MRILISGASGYLGSRLCKALKKEHHIIAITRNPDKFNHFNEKIADEIIILKSFDHNFLEKVIDSKPEIFIHLISLDSSASNSNPLSSFDVNVGNTFKLLNHLKDSKTLKKFIYFSTIHVYNSSLKKIDELTKPNPNNFYSLTHFLSEEIINYFNNVANFKCINLRLSNSYGEPVFENENCWKLVVNELVKSANEKKVISLNGEGSTSRDFIHYSDICDAINKLIILDNIKFNHNTYNLSSGNSLLLIELAELIKKEFNEEIKIFTNSNESYIPSTKKFVSKTTYSNERIKNLIQFNPITLSEGLFKMIKEFKN